MRVEGGIATSEAIPGTSPGMTRELWDDLDGRTVTHARTAVWVTPLS
ncbi:MAG: hypothetical protein QM621_05335 [Aeromicrobium sp.]